MTTQLTTTGVTFTDGTTSTTRTTFSGGSTGLTPSSATEGAVTLAGTLVTGNGGTGLTLSGASGNVLTSNGTTWTSVAPPAGGVTSLNGQTGAIVNTNFNAIGSYAIGAIKTANTSVTEGTTYAGSSIFQGTQGASYGITNTVFSGASNTNLGWAGTWRAMNRSRSNTADPCTGEIVAGNNLWVRVS